MSVSDSLGDAGSALWKAIAESRNVTDSHVPLVLNACRLADNLDRISVQLAESGLTVMNDRGDMVANPLLVEHRMQLNVLRQALHGLGVRELALEEAEGMTLQDQLAEARRARLEREAN